MMKNKGNDKVWSFCCCCWFWFFCCFYLKGTIFSCIALSLPFFPNYICKCFFIIEKKVDVTFYFEFFYILFSFFLGIMKEEEEEEKARFR